MVCDRVWGWRGGPDPWGNVPCDTPMMVFVENIGYKYDFEGMGWSMIGSGVGSGPDPWGASWGGQCTHPFDACHDI